MADSVTMSPAMVTATWQLGAECDTSTSRHRPGRIITSHHGKDHQMTIRPYPNLPAAVVLARMAAMVWAEHLPEDNYINRAVDLLSAAVKEPGEISPTTLDKVEASLESRAAKAAREDFPEAAEAAHLVKQAFTYVALNYHHDAEPTAVDVNLFDQMVSLASAVLVSTPRQVLDEINAAEGPATKDLSSSR